jgi:hypothetical protein
MGLWVLHSLAWDLPIGPRLLLASSAASAATRAGRHGRSEIAIAQPSALVTLVGFTAMAIRTAPA